MNHIHRLQQTNTLQEQALDAIAVEIQDLTGYLCSSKFHDDPTVQVQDVLNRLILIKDAGAEFTNQID